MRVFEKADEEAATNKLEIRECIKLRKMDSYLNQPKKLQVQDRWDFTRYSAPNARPFSYNKRTQPHEPKGLERRLLLFAETQIGKTGAFIQFLLKVVQASTSL